MFGLMTKRAAQRRAQAAADLAVRYAIAELDEDMKSALEAVRKRIENDARDLEISREREAEALAEVKRLRAENRFMLQEIANVRAALSCPGHSIVDDFGAEVFVFEEFRPCVPVPELGA